MLKVRCAECDSMPLEGLVVCIYCHEEFCAKHEWPGMHGCVYEEEDEWDLDDYEVEEYE